MFDFVVFTAYQYTEGHLMQKSALQWPGRPGFNPRSSHTKDSKKWYLMPPGVTLSIIRYRSRVNWSNLGNGVAPSPTPWCSSYRKGSLLVTLDCGSPTLLTFIWLQLTNNNPFEIIKQSNDYFYINDLYRIIRFQVNIPIDNNHYLSKHSYTF